MPRTYKTPPPKNVPVTILRGTKANGTNVYEGDQIMVDLRSANLLCGQGMAARGHEAKPKAKAKVARGRPPANAER